MSERPRALELFAGEGGAAYGLHLAGFDVTAVDVAEHPNRCPDVEWVTADATAFPLDGFDLVTAGPPCTDRSTMRTAAEPARGGVEGTGWMLPHTLDRFRAHAAATGIPWAVENVPVPSSKRLMPSAITLCGSMFGLQDGGWWLKRHRLIDSSAPIWAPAPCSCRGKPIIGVYGDMTQNDRTGGAVGRRPHNDRRAGIPRARRLMGMPWASAKGLALAVPVAYWRWVGEQLHDHITGV